MINITRWQVLAIVGLCLLGIIFAAPNLAPRKAVENWPSYVPRTQFNLGLDLQGGAHLLMEVDRKDVLKTYFEQTLDSLRKELRGARVGYRNLGIARNGVTFDLRDPAQADKARSAMRQVVRDVSSQSAVITGSSDAFTYDISGKRARLTLTEAGAKARLTRVLEQSIEVIRRRIDETGTREPTIQRQGDDRILIQVPGVSDPERIKRILGKTAKMTYHLVDPSAVPAPGMRVPPGSMLVPDDRDPQIQYLLYKRVEVSGENLVDAQQTMDRGRPVVAFRFDPVGARKFCRVTSQNVNKLFAIVLDNKVITAPRIISAICDGSGIITGGFTVQSANDLALLLRAGALPAELVIVEERTVGPGLGADSIAAGKVASVLGLILVIIFMAAAYGRFGMMANIALATNLVLLAALLSLLQATLTLPGIAGIVLTIGMAVDANVLIFERIREEVRAGRTPLSAIDTGYRRALTTIIDSNLTTFIAAFLLFIFGSGPIKGFGVTLAIGLVTSMFTAIMVTRLMVVGWWRRKRPASLPI